MFDSPQTDEMVSVVPESGGFTLEDLDLETESVVEVDVKGGENPGLMGVAGSDEALSEFALLVVIEQGQAGHGLAIFVLDLVLHQPATNEIADGFRSVSEALAVEQFLESGEQLALDGNGDSLKRHRTPNPNSTNPRLSPSRLTPGRDVDLINRQGPHRGVTTLEPVGKE